MDWVGQSFQRKKRRTRRPGSFRQGQRKIYKYKHDPADPNSLADNNVSDIYEDSKNNLWVGTNGTGCRHWTGLPEGIALSLLIRPRPETRRPPLTATRKELVSFIREENI